VFWHTTAFIDDLSLPWCFSGPAEKLSSSISTYIGNAFRYRIAFGTTTQVNAGIIIFHHLIFQYFSKLRKKLLDLYSM
jgi:hypothetical protein